MIIKRLLGNNVLVRFLDQPKPQINGIHVPTHVIPQNPRAVILMVGEGRTSWDRDKRKHRGYTHRYRQNHERDLLKEVEPGDLVQINTKMGRVAVEFKGQKCHIVSTLDVQCKIDVV